MSALVELKGVSRWYGEVIALNGVSLELEPGIHGILGPNGAGKTTLLRLLSGQIRPSLGQVRVLGMDPFANPALYRRVGIVPDLDAMPEGLTGHAFLTAIARLHGDAAGKAGGRSDATLARVGLSDAARRRIRGYSKGMRQRLKLGQAILHEPELLILGEPLSGLDPLVRHEVMDLVRDWAQKGGSVIVSSHILHEVERMTRRVLLVLDGPVRAEGDVADIRDLIESEPRRILVKASEPKALAAELLRAGHVVGVSFGEDLVSLVVSTRRAREVFAQLPRIALDKGIRIHEIRSEDDDLESVFSYLTRRR